MALPTPKVVDSIPERKRNGEASLENELVEFITSQPLDGPKVDNHKATKVFQFEGMAQNLASNLRKNHGIDAANRGIDKGKGTLYVRWVPDIAEQVKAEAAARGAKISAARAK